MGQPDPTSLEAQNAVDDWGDFSAVITQLEQQEHTQEQNEVSAPPTESKQAATEDNSEAVAGLLEVAFTLTEQATSVISNVEFEFDQKGKQAVIDAAVPVFDKHGATLMPIFGGYIEEATLILAVLGLTYASKKQIATLKREQKEKEHEQEASSTDAAEPG